MAVLTLEDLSFTYPGGAAPTLNHVNLTVAQGEYILLCGKSGSGKTTLLRHLKTVLSPHGSRTGTVRLDGSPLEEIGLRQHSEQIGFVMQNPDDQIVTDKVWHELAFGLESMGLKTPEIRTRVSEMASFFGIQTWFHKKITELSGGQKQLLNLASIMVMQPSVLILDEPTSQLDPIAAADFLETVHKINRELGTTVILTEHRLEDVFPMSDRVIVLEEGRMIADSTPGGVGAKLKQMNHELFVALPTPMRVYAGVDNAYDCPVTVREGRKWLETIAAEKEPDLSEIPKDPAFSYTKPMIELHEVWFRYEKDAPDVVKGLSADIYEGEFFAIVGGNGTGKTTTLSIISGILNPCRGEVKLDGRKLSSISDAEKFGGLLGVLPQSPQALFVKKTVALDLQEMLKGKKLTAAEKEERIAQAVRLCELEPLLTMHPYDLSGGEQQRAALAKVMLLRPRILLLDEPTKGLDGHFKEKLAGILKDLQAAGTTIVLVSHDIEFCAKYADRCAMFFDGGITSCDTPRRFFGGKSFYTTAANRMARTTMPDAVLAEDMILALGGRVLEQKKQKPESGCTVQNNWGLKEKTEETKKRTPKRTALGGGMIGLFVITALLFHEKFADWRQYLVQFALVLEAGLALSAFFPGQELAAADRSVQPQSEKRNLSKRTWAALAMVLIAVPLTIFIGCFYLADRKYYFISLMIILETFLPFGMVFEGRKPQARELVIVSVLCALAVAGRAAFFMLPQFKPVVAVVIIAGVCFGGETGFLVGAVTGFVSNFFFGQSPLTPWQMFSFGIIGFFAGVLFRKGLLRKTKSALCIFGGLTTFFLYGGIMNTASVFMWRAKPNAAAFMTAYLMGIPFDLIHAFATVFFLYFISGAMIEKLDRIKVKYGLLER
ncbi:MAG TPA: septum site-determining protein MinC [Clostridiales bacterium]|nr:septum site-determining protein MinC [Clostridiales bacterium]